MIYHTECYKLITHTANLQPLQKIYQSSVNVNQQDPNILHDEKSSSQLPEEPVEEDSRKTLQSRTDTYNKNACIICQQGEKLHKVDFLETSSSMLRVIELLRDKSFFHLNEHNFKFKGCTANMSNITWVNTPRKASKTIAEKQEI